MNFGFYDIGGDYITFNSVEQICRDRDENRVYVYLNGYEQQVTVSRHEAKAECNEAFQQLVAKYAAFMERIHPKQERS